jgi:hypothetical protein
MPPPIARASLPKNGLFDQLRLGCPGTETADLMIATLFRYRDQGKFALHAFAVMPDHIHVLITPAIDQGTARCVQFIKGGFSFAVRELFPGEVWHSGYHEHPSGTQRISRPRSSTSRTTQFARTTLITPRPYPV